MPIVKPWPAGSDSRLVIRLGGHITASMTAKILDRFQVPFDMYVRRVDRFLEVQGGSFPTNIKLRTVLLDLQLVADLATGQAISGTQQTLHTDIVNILIPRGEFIDVIATTGSGDRANLYDTIHLEPKTTL